MTRWVNLVLLWPLLSGCTYSYEVGVTVVGGQVPFDADPQKGRGLHPPGDRDGLFRRDRLAAIDLS